MAQAWLAIARRHTNGSGPDAAVLAERCREALQVSNDHPVISFYLGAARKRFGARRLAMAAWHSAAEGGRAWGEPLARMASTALEMGEARRAISLAQRAVRRSGTGSGVLITVLRARYALLERSDRVTAEQLARGLEELAGEDGRLDRRLVPLHVGLTARTKGKKAAQKALHEVLEANQGLSAETLISLADVSDQNGLGLEDACLDRCLERHGPSPALALGRAQRLVRDGKFDTALALVATPENASGLKKLPWQSARARLLGSYGRLRAMRAWIELADGHPDSARAQWIALRRDTVWRDEAFVRRALGRLREQGARRRAAWRLMRARLVMRGPEDEQSARRALRLLRPLIRSAENPTRAHALGAEALRVLGETERAITHLEQVRDRGAYPTEARFAIARVARRAGDRARALEALRAVAEGDETSRGEKRRAASALFDMGELDAADTTLKRIHGDEETPADPLLARLHLRRGETEKALAVAERLLEEPTVGHVWMAVRIRLAAGRREAARDALTRLDAVRAAPGEKPLA